MAGIKLLSTLVGSENTEVASCFITSTEGMNASGLTSIHVPINTTVDTCGLHVGTGSHGFFVGNATGTGFVPKIKGQAQDITDQGIKIVGSTSGDSGSAGAVWIDASNVAGGALANRGIVDFSNNSVLKACIDKDGHMHSACFCGGLAGHASTAGNAGTLDSLDSTQFLRADVADVKTSGDLCFSDNVQAVFGTGADLRIYHNGSNSIIDNRVGNLNIYSCAGTELSAVFQQGGCVQLHYDGSGKFKTVSNGTCTTGNHYSSGNVCATNFHTTTGGQIRAHADVAGEGVVISGSGVTANAHGLVDFVENVNGLYGFQLCMDGGGNQFYIGRKDNAATSTKVMCINRGTNDVYFTGIAHAGTCFTAPRVCGTACVRGAFVYSEGQSCAATCMVTPVMKATNDAYVTDDLFVGGAATTSSKIIVCNSDAAVSCIALYGPSQGTGKVYVGQSTTHGGGIIYNGDGTPTEVGTTDAISFYRRTADVETEVFSYPHNGNNVTFAGNLIATCFCGKATDSQLLDNIDSSSFLRSNTTDQKTAGNLVFNDSISAAFGTGSDMLMYHDGTNGYIDNNANNLHITSPNTIFLCGALLYVYDSGSLSLYTAAGQARSPIFCATSCLKGPVVCATTAFRTTGTGNRYCGGTGCGTAVDWTATSDCRKKKCIEPYDECGIDKINHFMPVCYTWCHDESCDIGFIAQDVLDVQPTLVSGSEKEGYALKYDKISAIAVKAIQELSCKVKDLETEVERLKQ